MIRNNFFRLLLYTVSASIVVGQVFVAAWSAHGGDTSTSEPPLLWAADSEGGAPYIFLDPDDPGRYKGFEVNLVEALEKELGRKIRFRQTKFDALVPGLNRGDFDFAMNGLEVTPDRERAVRFSRPYYIYRLQLVVRSGEKRFDSLEELKKLGGQIGTLEDTAAERLLDQMGVAKRIYDDQVQPYVDLEHGNIDAVLLDLPIALYIAKPNKRLKFVGQTEPMGYYAIAFRKDEEELAAQFDAALQRLINDGRLRQIYEKWGLWNDDQSALAPRIRLPMFSASRRGSGRSAVTCRPCSGRPWSPSRSACWACCWRFRLACQSHWRRYGPPPLRWAAAAYVEFFRGIPVLLLLFFLYYGLPVVSEHFGLPSLKLATLQAAVLGFGLNYAAYEAEIYRAGIGAIPVGQWEAAASLGMSRPLCFRAIILPQAIRIILPPMTNDFIALFKNTSVVSVIAVVELTKQYQILAKSSLKYLEIGLVTALLYLVMSVPLGYLSRSLEARWGKGS